MLRTVHYLECVRLSGGGVARAVLDFCAVFARLGHRITLITADPVDVPPEWSGAGGPGVPKAIAIDAPRRLGLLPRSARAQLVTALRGADVLHLHAPWTTSNLQVASVARRMNIPYVLSVHGMLDDWSMAQKRLKKRLYLALVGNRLLRGAARIHCTAQAELDQASRWFPANRGIVLPLIMDFTIFEQLPGPEPARARFSQLANPGPHLLFLSRVHPKKGVELLILAAAELLKRNRPCTVLIAGPGDPDYVGTLRQLAQAHGVADSVHFLGMVQGLEKVSLYQAADVFVLPTSQENFGLVLLEALACCTPVITTRGVDIWKELQQAGASIVERTPQAIASEIDRVLDDPHAPERRQRGRDWVLGHLEPTRVAGEYAALYQSVVAHAAAPPPTSSL